MKRLFSEIIEAQLETLLEWSRDNALSSDEEIYQQVLVAYLQGDLGQLLLNSRRFHDEGALSELAKLRYSIRARTATIESVQIALQSVLQNVLPRETDAAILGEAHFVTGYAFYTLHAFELAISNYEKAIPLLREAGAPKKALKCLQNIVACKSTLSPNEAYIPSYHAIYREAKRLKDHASCGLALMNISREYQKMGALNVALETVEKALAHFQKDFGTVHHDLALAHRAHLYLQLGADTKAMVDIERCLASAFPEVRKAIEVLEKIDFKNENSVESSLLNPTWRARAKNFMKEGSGLSFTSLEEKLLAVLRERALTKAELAERLYGRAIDLEASEDRIKNLLTRIRKKSPGLIAIKDGRYSLLEKRIS